MKFQAIPLGVNILSSNLKVGLLAGIVGVSASTGAVATSFSSEPLGSAFKTAISPVKTFFAGNISPHFEKVLGGAKKIGGKLGDWGKEAYKKKDDALQWIKTNFSSSTLKSGFTTIFNKTKEWADKGKSTLSSTYGAGKNTVIPFLSQSGKVRELLYYGSEASNILKALGALLTASALSAATGGEGEASGGSGADEEDDDEEGESVSTPPLSKIWDLINSGKLGEVVSSVTKMISENLDVVKQLEKTDVNKIINFVLGEPEKVKPRIDEMQNPKKKEEKSNWGNYGSKDDFMKALLPPPDFAKLLADLIKTTTGEEISDYVTTADKKFSVDNVKKLFDCDGDGKDSSNCSSPEEMGLTDVLSKLLEGLFPAKKQE